MPDQHRPTPRNSSVEALKLLAMALIVLSHAMPASGAGDHVMNLAQATTSVQRLLIVLCQYCGHVGNAIFLVSSAWFLVGSSRVQVRKMVHIALDTWLVSVLFLGLFLALGYPLGFGEMVRQLLPLASSANWFVICYLQFYAIHPLLNVAVERLTRRQLLALDLALLLLYGVVSLALGGAYGYNNLVGFVCVFFFTAYVKKYLPERCDDRALNRRLLVLGICTLVGLVLLTNLAGLFLPRLSGLVTRWNVFVNPCNVLIALSSLNLARTRPRVDQRVNWLSSGTLLIYVIHGNRLVMDHWRQDYFAWVYDTFGYGFQLGWVLALFAALLIGGVGLSIAYRRWVQPYAYRLADRVYDRAAQFLREP